MSPPPEAPEATEPATEALGGLSTAWRVVGLGLLTALATWTALTCWPGSIWAAMALPFGLGVAALLRLGPVALAGTGGGILAGLPFLHGGKLPPWDEGALVVLATVAGAWMTYAALKHAEFDSRLQRRRDLLVLALASILGAALPAAVVASSLPLSRGASGLPWTDFLEGWAVLVLGTLLGLLTSLAIEARTTHESQMARRWTHSALALLLMGLVLTVWTLAPQWPPAWRVVAFIGLPMLAIGLSMHGHLATAMVGILAAVLIVGLQSGTAGWPWAEVPAPEGVGLWLAGTLCGLLFTHGLANELQGQVRRWEWALDGSRLGVAEWQPASGEGFASAAWRSLTQFSGRQWSPRAWRDSVHPEDAQALEHALEAVSRGAAGRQRLELRMPHSGGWRWFEATLLVIERSADDRPARILATLTDIHEWHDVQERQLMSVSLFQHLHEGLLVTDAELRALDANPAYTRILGITRDEMLGTVPSLLRPDPADPQARQQRAAMWTGLRTQGNWRGELLERRRNGEMCMLQTTISTVYGPTRDLRYHVVVIADITEQTVQREQLERQAHFDELTRLPNRARLSQLLDEAMRAADRDGYLLVVCYLDLDHFKPVNDRWGHAAGDRLLAELAVRLRSALRSRDGWADAAARLGGDEFVLLLRAGTMEEARLAVERVLRVVAQPYAIEPGEDAVQVSASMGASIYPIDRSDADTLLRHADHAMYGAKQAGRNGYLLFDPEHRRRNEERVMAIGRVQEALELQEFVLHYQPKVDMRSGRVIGLEALLRWDHPQQGVIAPLQFLPLIENTALSSRVGDWVIAQALGHLAQWRRSGLDISVSVNVSARHLQEPDFALRLSELLAQHDQPLARSLELEMLESTAHADIEVTSSLIARCRSMGVRFALDDFGTGYSTLTYLKRLPVDVLKIDRSFVRHMLDDSHDRAIVEGVIGLARTFGCLVVAEGVEAPAQARLLLELGCDVGQGTGIAAPMRPDQVAQWVRDYRGMFALAPAESSRPASA